VDFLERPALDWSWSAGSVELIALDVLPEGAE
jgi:hypothetical protein